MVRVDVDVTSGAGKGGLTCTWRGGVVRDVRLQSKHSLHNIQV